MRLLLQLRHLLLHRLRRRRGGCWRGLLGGSNLLRRALLRLRLLLLLSLLLQLLELLRLLLLCSLLLELLELRCLL